MPNITKYAVLTGKAIWSQYGKTATGGILRGAGSKSSPKLMNSSKTIRDTDFKKIPAGNGKIKITPAKNTGLSFATNIPRLKKLKLEGYVWAFHATNKDGNEIELPEGLGFSYDPDDPDHPMLTVTREMYEDELVEKLDQVTALLVNTEVKLTKSDFKEGEIK